MIVSSTKIFVYHKKQHILQQDIHLFSLRALMFGYKYYGMGTNTTIMCKIIHYVIKLFYDFMNRQNRAN